jgi:signal transduction histidine kinase
MQLLPVSTEPTMVRREFAHDGSCFADAVSKILFGPLTAAKTIGLSVGPSISKSMVEAHHGRIWDGSGPGGGSIFSFTLSLAAAESDE